MITKIGHRGAMGYAPENTLKSFRKALELNVEAVELDVYVCKSGELVVIHDDKVSKTTNGKGRVVEKTLKELQKLNAGDSEKIPTLVEVLDVIHRKAIVNIELKGDGTVKPVVEIIKNYINNKSWEYDDFIVSSFDHYKLKELKNLNPKIKIGAGIMGIPINFTKFAKDMNANYVEPCIDFVNKEFVDDAHKRGLKVHVWTANDPRDIKRAKNLGVDGIFSDFPDRL